MRPFLFLLLFIIIITTSCDVFHIGNGVIVDNITKKPIDSVSVEAFLIDKNETIFINQKLSDSTGKFDIGAAQLTAKEGKMDFIIVFSKQGYYNLIVNKPRNDTIFLIKKGFTRSTFEKIYTR